MGRRRIKKKAGGREQRDSLASSVPRSREQCRRHLFPFIKPDIFPTRSSGAIPFLSISFSLFLKPAARTKAAQRPYKRLSAVHKNSGITTYFWGRLKRDGTKEGWIFHFAKSVCRISFIPPLTFFFLFFFRRIRLRPISARRVARGSDCQAKN